MVRSHWGARVKYRAPYLHASGPLVRRALCDLGRAVREGRQAADSVTARIGYSMHLDFVYTTMQDLTRLRFTFPSAGSTSPVRVVSASGHDQTELLRHSTAQPMEQPVGSSLIQKLVMSTNPAVRRIKVKLDVWRKRNEIDRAFC